MHFKKKISNFLKPQSKSQSSVISVATVFYHLRHALNINSWDDFIQAVASISTCKYKKPPQDVTV